MADPSDHAVNQPNPNPAPAFTAVNQLQRAQSIGANSVYRPNPAYRPPHQERARHSIYDIPLGEDEPSRPASKRVKRGKSAGFPTTSSSLAQTTTVPGPKEQTRTTSRPGQAKNTKGFANARVSKPNITEHRSHSNNDKTPSNILPAASAPTTTMQCAIAMTTMQKLATFRYQPSSTGLVHKAVASSAQIPDCANQEKGEVKGHDWYESIIPLQVIQSHQDQPSGYEDFGMNLDFKAHASPQPQEYTEAASHFLSTSISSYQPTDSYHVDFGDGLSRDDQASLVPASANKQSCGLSFSNTAAQTEFYVPCAAPEDDMAVSQSYQTVEPSMLVKTAISPSERFWPALGDGKDEYDEDFVIKSFHNGHLLPDTNDGHALPSVSVEGDQAEEQAETVTHLGLSSAELPTGDLHRRGNANDYNPIDHMLEETWNHSDYTGTLLPLNEATYEQGPIDVLELHSMEVISSKGLEFNVNSASGINDAENVANAVHSHELITIPESPNPLSGLSSGTGRTAMPEVDTEDYFAALAEFDDDDLRQVEIPTKVQDGEKISPACQQGSEVGQVDEDYLAAFGDFTDEDLNDVEIPSRRRPAMGSSSACGVVFLDLAEPAIQVPATQFNERRDHENIVQSTMPSMAASSQAFFHCSGADTVDDEYPLDEDEQADLQQLSASRYQAILETREPPSSILHSEEDMRDMDIYDPKLRYSPVDNVQPKTSALMQQLNAEQPERDEPLAVAEDWQFLVQPRAANSMDSATTVAICPDAQNDASRPPVQPVIDDDYTPLAPFARPPFPEKVPPRSPVAGLSSNVVLRTCFRIGAALSQASLCSRDNQDAVTELFARVTFSAREGEGKKQNFQFGDIFHNKPPFLSGVLEKYTTSDLQKTESFELITTGKERREGDLGEMVRILGRVKRVIQGRGYTMEIVNIRKTDWEEVRWTKKVLGVPEVVP